MFRPMRRFKQALAPERCQAILRAGTSGVLALSGDDGYPYAVPLSYLYTDDGQLLFHCAATGHKLDAIRHNPKVSFCVIDQDRIVPETFTTWYRSVIAFGRARILTDPGEKRAALHALGAKYSPEQSRTDALDREVDQTLARVTLVAVAIDHLTCKQAVELTRPQ